MFEAKIDRYCMRAVVLGPTDTRDEAARLARSWMESHPHSGTARPGEVEGVQIRRVEEE